MISVGIGGRRSIKIKGHWLSKKREDYKPDDCRNYLCWNYSCSLPFWSRDHLLRRPNYSSFIFFFSSRRRHTRFLNVTGVRRVLFRSGARMALPALARRGVPRLRSDGAGAV